MNQKLFNSDNVCNDFEMTAFFTLTYKQWLSLKKKVDKEFDNGKNSYGEVRFYVLPKELDFSSHCCLDKKR